MHVMSYHFLEPVVGYHEIDASGRLVRTELVPTAKPVMVHDMAMTATRIIVLDLPVVFDLDLAKQGKAMPFRWDHDYVARIGLLPRDATAADTVWVEVDPCYVFHPMNAYDDGDTVVLDVARHRTMFRNDLDDSSDGHPQLVRWRLNPATGTVLTEMIDDRPQEFPRIDERLTGQPYRYGYAAGVGVAQLGGGSEVSTTVVKHDLHTGAAEAHALGAGRTAGEFVFVAASPDAGEDEGWLMGFVHDAATDRSELVVLDATNLAADPVARVLLPTRVPAGFHGNWVPAGALEGDPRGN
jgi:carotenoid cleavage dioxygenase